MCLRNLKVSAMGHDEEADQSDSPARHRSCINAQNDERPRMGRASSASGIFCSSTGPAGSLLPAL